MSAFPPAATPAGLQGPRRKLIHATLFEIFAITIVTVAMKLWSDKDVGASLGLAVSCSVTAVLWNMAYNTLFEAWERRQADRRRTVLRRAMHALGFETGLAIMTVPMIAWWLNVGWWAALLADLGLMAFFLFYTFGFNWLFDHVFGLPASALAAAPELGGSGQP